MELKTRTLLEEDYSMLEKWWSAWGWPAVSKDILPDNGTGGVMVEYKGKPIVAGFIYWSNSGLCWLIGLFQIQKVIKEQDLLLLSF
jgi:hypothetical protein